jgi:acyl carrier protein phosphodiesterase
MNYLAHIHLAHVTQTSLLGNFLGDFVKGSDLQHLPLKLQHGVRLHRAIDTFTDQHTLVKYLKRQFPISIRRMSGITIDIYFDHLLSLRWQQYSKHCVHSVLKQFYRELANSKVPIDGRFNDVKDGLLSHQWLHEYAHKEAVNRAFFQIERRLKYRVEFAQESIEFISSAQEEFDQAFTQFYPALVDYCHDKSS